MTVFAEALYSILMSSHKMYALDSPIPRIHPDIPSVLTHRQEFYGPSRYFPIISSTRCHSARLFPKCFVQNSLFQLQDYHLLFSDGLPPDPFA